MQVQNVLKMNFKLKYKSKLNKKYYQFQKQINIVGTMGNNASFSTIQRKYGRQGVDYIVNKYHERKIYDRINDQIKRLKDHANLQESQDLQFLNQQKRVLQKSLNDAKNAAQSKKKGSIAQAEAKSKQKIQAFSGYTEQVKKLQKLDKQVRDKHQSERVKMQQRVRQQVRKHQTSSRLNRIPEYDNHPDNYRKSIQDQCIQKNPDRARQIDATDLQRKLTWQNYKQNFVGILNRDQVRKDTQAASNHIRNNIVPGGAPICC